MNSRYAFSLSGFSINEYIVVETYTIPAARPLVRFIHTTVSKAKETEMSADVMRS